MKVTKQRALMIAALAIAAVIVATVVLWYALQTPPPVQPFSSLYQGDSDYRYGDEEFEGGCTVIRTSAEWHAFWSEHVSLITPKPPIPSIDFDVHMVLSCFLGWQSSSGPSIEIESIVLSEISYVAYVDRNYTQTQLTVITNPCHIVRVPATREQVMFLDAATGEQIPEFIV